MAEIRYLDFDLVIERTEEGYTARVLNSPAGQAAAGFRLPFSELELENFLLRIGRTRRGVRRLESPEMQAAKAFGGRLFQAVFGGTVQGCLRSSLDEASRQGVGLRVRLRLAGASELADLPWEYLYNPALNRFLVLSVDTPLVRYVDLPERIRPLAVKPPLRVLVMISCPSGPPQLDVEGEWAKLRGALDDLEQRGLVALERLEEATLAALQRRLRRGVYHVFHFVGHGGFDRQAQDGVLLLEDERGRGRPVSGQDLGVLLHDERTLRLAILNACEGARTSRSDPFAGTAQSLVQQGVPAVVAMQFEITDEAAITLAHEFYGALADGYPVDAALAEARKAIFAQENDVEWGTPVLYMRAPDGRIFDVAQVGLAETRLPSVAPEVDRELEQRLERLYTAALSAFWLEEWERACRSFQSIVDVRPDYQNAAAKLEEAQRQRKLNALYAQAQAAREGEDWQAALSALKELVAEAPDFKDATALLEAAGRQRQLADLYAEARRLHQAQQWQAVVNVFAQIGAVEPDYPDPEDLLPTAEQEFAALKRQAELDELYGRAVRRMDAGRWHEAQQLLVQVQEMEPGFREAERLLSKAEAEIAREDAEQERQEQIATLDEQAVGLARARQWRQALAKMDEIRALDPEFADPQGIAARAQEEVAREEEEARRQNELAALYAEAVRLLRAGQYQEALEKWGEVQGRDPRYRDRHEVQATARKKLAALAKVTPPGRDTPGWMWLLGGAVIVIAVVGIMLAVGVMQLPGALPPPVSATLSGTKVLVHDDFDQSSLPGWEYRSSHVKASNGVVEVTGTPGWVTFLHPPHCLEEGEGVLVLFKYDAGAEFKLILERGAESWASDYRVWGLWRHGFERLDFECIIVEGAEFNGSPLLGNLTPSPDTWYYLLLAVGERGERVMRVWERDTLSQRGGYQRAFGEDWAGQTPDCFFVRANKGKLYVDAFTEISFSSIR